MAAPPHGQFMEAVSCFGIPQLERESETSKWGNERNKVRMLKAVPRNENSIMAANVERIENRTF